MAVAGIAAETGRIRLTSSAWLAALTNRRIGVIMLLGFASGLPLALTGGMMTPMRR